MAFVSFVRKAMDGNKDGNVAKKDGQFIVDTNNGYLYTDINGSTRLPIIDRKDANHIDSNEKLKKTTRNGWYYLNYGDGNTFTVKLDDTGDHTITSSSGHLSVDGTNKGWIVQTLYLHNTEGHILHRHTENGGEDWSSWSLLDNNAKIKGSKWNKIFKTGSYYFDNRKTINNGETKEWYCVPEVAGAEYKYNYYHMRVESYGEKGMAYGIVTYYPMTSSTTSIKYFRRKYYKESGKDTEWSGWEVCDLRHKAVNVDNKYELDKLVHSNLFRLKGERTFNIFGYTPVKLTNALLEVKGYYVDNSNTTDNTVVQILYPRNRVECYGRRCVGSQWTPWVPMFTPAGFILDIDHDPNNPKNSVSDSTIESRIKSLPTGIYLIKANKYSLNADSVSNLNLAKKYKLNTCLLTVKKFAEEKYTTQELEFETVSKYALPNIQNGTKCILKRTQYQSGDFDEWSLSAGANSKVVITGSNTASGMINAIAKAYNNHLETGTYQIEHSAKSSTDTAVGDFTIDGYTFKRATIRIERYDQSLDYVRAFLYPTNSQYALSAQLKLNSSDQVSDTQYWRWDEGNFPKKKNQEYLLTSGQYYKKVELTRHSSNKTLEEFKKTATNFQIFAEDPYTSATSRNNTQNPIIHCMNAPTGNSHITKVNVLKVGHFVGSDDPTYVVKVLNVDEPITTSLVLGPLLETYYGASLKSFYYTDADHFGKDKTTYNSNSKKWRSVLNKTLQALTKDGKKTSDGKEEIGLWSRPKVFIIAKDYNSKSINNYSVQPIIAEFYYTKK